MMQHGQLNKNKWGIKMKKLTFITIIMLIMLVLSACTSQNVDNTKLNIVTSFYPMYIATINITDGAENVEVKNLTNQTTGCLHDYQITTSDMIKLSDADILVINGDGMENFIDKAISAYEDLEIVNASEGIKENHEELLENDFHEDESEHDHEHEHGSNSHYWVSVSLYMEQIKNIKDRLKILDPVNESIYEKNARDYLIKLQNLKNKMHEELDILENKNIITFHEAFDFFAEEFDLNIVSVIEREPGTYPSSRDVADIIDEVRTKNVNAIFVEPQYSRTAADTIAKETNINVYMLDPIVTGDLEKDAYIDIMEKNLNTLIEALS